MIGLTVSLSGQDALKQQLEERIQKIAHLDTAAGEIAQEFFAIERQQFSSGGGLSGGWPPLSPRYQAWKDQHYPGAAIMVLTGRLRQSLISMTSETVFMVSSRNIRIGTSVPYAVRHQLGIGVPQRELIPVDFVKERFARVIAQQLGS